MLHVSGRARLAAFSLFAPLAIAGAWVGTASGATIAPKLTPPAPVAAIDSAIPTAPVASLSALVERHGATTAADAEAECLATAVYFEAKSESLKGQLAVAHVILNRVKSGRFANSICGVVKQRGQFSFVRNGQLPRITNNAQWKNAIAIATIAARSLHTPTIGNALFFHARRVSPNWAKRTQVAAIGNHIFYR